MIKCLTAIASSRLLWAVTFLISLFVTGCEVPSRFRDVSTLGLVFVPKQMNNQDAPSPTSTPTPAPGGGSGSDGSGSGTTGGGSGSGSTSGGGSGTGSTSGGGTGSGSTSGGGSGSGSTSGGGTGSGSTSGGGSGTGSTSGGGSGTGSTTGCGNGTGTGTGDDDDGECHREIGDTIASASVTVSPILVSTDSSHGSLPISQGSATFDLLHLDTAISTYLSEVVLPAGTIREVRLIVISGTLTLNDGSSYDLVVPSGAETGIKIKVDTTIVSTGAIQPITLHFDTRCNFNRQGPASSPHGFHFRPVIHAQ